MPVPSVGVPAIPQWFREWGWVPLGMVFLVLSALIADVGSAHGKDIGWFLLLLAACAVGSGLAYRRRLGKALAAFRRCLGWADIEVIGDRPGGDGGVDILAIDPRGRRFAIQCKRYTLPRKVDIDGPRKLNGSLAYEHQRRLGLIVTSSELTKPARALAGKSGIQVIERPDLTAQMARIRDEAGQDGDMAA
jgi:hypothetical protein